MGSLKFGSCVFSRYPKPHECNPNTVPLTSHFELCLFLNKIFTSLFTLEQVRLRSLLAIEVEWRILLSIERISGDARTGTGFHIGDRRRSWTAFDVRLAAVLGWRTYAHHTYLCCCVMMASSLVVIIVDIDGSYVPDFDIRRVCQCRVSGCAFGHSGFAVWSIGKVRKVDGPFKVAAVRTWLTSLHRAR